MTPLPQTTPEEKRIVGTALYEREIEACRPEHRDLMIEVWSPTPWMVDVDTIGRAAGMRSWCLRYIGSESSPIHRRNGWWHEANVTIYGRTWYGFATEEMMNDFLVEFPEPTKAAP